MATDSIQVSGVINASPDRIYHAWLDSSEHSSMTGGRATVDPMLGGQFTCWDGKIRGTTVELEPGRRIVQRWRSDEFPPESPDSRLEVLLEPTESGTRVTFLHSDIPEGQGTQLEEGWQRYYLDPMSSYFQPAEEAYGEESEAEVEAPVAPKPAAQPQPKAPARKAKPVAKKKAASARSSKKKPAARKAGARKAAGKKAARKSAAKRSKARSGSRKSARRKR